MIDRKEVMNAFMAIVGAAALSLGAAPAQAQAEIVLPHVHGLSFSADGKALLAAVHVGVAEYRDGRWSRAPGPAHDFMGFSVTRSAIYSSGHPAPGAPLRNPLGRVNSTDGGATWRALGLAAEADFHAMAVGYGTNAVYVVAGRPNAAMARPGLYYTLDDAASWTRSDARGIDIRILALAAHPGDPATVAIGTEGGLFLSRDYGKTFRRSGAEQPATAVLFLHDGKHLLYAKYRSPVLLSLSLEGAAKAAGDLPPLGDDAVAYLAQNPANSREIAFATYQRDVYLSRDGGKAWTRIAHEGRAP
jgi:photosystem II stability/assembly factor-like uncharacterized protein